jgi:replicative DNA helicase
VLDTQSLHLPADIETENDLLGTILLGKATIDEISAFVDMSDFYDQKHKFVFKAMSVLSIDGIKPDINTVFDWLKTAGLLKHIGDRHFLVDLVKNVRSGINAVNYAKIIKEHSRRRHLIQELSIIVNDATTGTDPDDLCAVIENVLVSNRSHVPAVESYLFDNAEEMLTQAKGITTGFYDLDQKIVCLENGCLIIVGGFTGMGKSAFGYALARNAVLAGHRAAIFDLEMTPKQRAHRLMSSETGKKLHDIRVGNLTIDEKEKCLKSLYQIPVMFFHNWNGKPSFVRTQLSRIKQENRPELVVVDYLGFMRSDTKEERHDLMIGAITKSLKRTAQSMNIPIVLLSQFSRVKDEREPMLSDLRGSGEIEQDADVVLFIHRNNTTPNKANIIIAKGRQDGPGRVELNFYEEYASFNKPPSTIQSCFDTRNVK